MTYNPSYNDKLSSRWCNLADERLGTKVLYATDDFFAEKENLIKPGRGIFIQDKYTDRGKWMDGWESKRKRAPGNDYCIIRLGQPGYIFGFDIDTNHFLGNHPPHASVEGCFSTTDPDDNTQWEAILKKSHLDPGSQNLFEVSKQKPFTHVRLQIYPDGGVARFRVYGDPYVDWAKKSKEDTLDLACVVNGAKVVKCNDMFFGSKNNLIYPDKGKNMGDGWETKRRREPGNDWAIIAFGALGKIEKIEIDTAYFKGNYPDFCSVEGANLELAQSDNFEAVQWKEILAKSKLEADKQHSFVNIHDVGGVTHVRLQIYPDGGISRFRCWGKLL